jgi:1-carboxybiuret hydrolase subunit AtzG-like protein
MPRRPQKPKPRSRPSPKARTAVKARKRTTPAPRASNALDDFIVSGARALGLPVDKAWMPAVRTHLDITLRHGATVTAFALPDEAEPAPVFKA